MITRREFDQFYKLALVRTVQRLTESESWVTVAEVAECLRFEVQDVGPNASYCGAIFRNISTTLFSRIETDQERLTLLSVLLEELVQMGPLDTNAARGYRIRPQQEMTIPIDDATLADLEKRTGVRIESITGVSMDYSIAEQEGVPVTAHELLTGGQSIQVYCAAAKHRSDVRLRLHYGRTLGAVVADVVAIHTDGFNPPLSVGEVLARITEKEVVK